MMDIFGKLSAMLGRRDKANEDVPVMGRQPGAAATSGFDEIHEQAVLDRELPSVNRRRGNNRMRDAVVMLVMLGVAFWVFYNMSGKDTVEAQKVVKPSKIESNLPPLDILKPPPPVQLASPEVPAIHAETMPIPLAQSEKNPATADGAVSPRPQTTQERKMESSLLLPKPEMKSAPVAEESNDHKAIPAAAGPRVGPNAVPPLPEPSARSEQNELAKSLQPMVTKAVEAKLLPNRNYIIAKGASLDCALETAIDSTVPGITTCRLTRDIYSDNGRVVLLDRGSQLVGEYQGGIRQGQARIFVLWTRAKTPNGVVIDLNSPGADTLGRAGHEGWVDTHFMERFGAAIMLSMVKDAWAYARSTQAKDGSGGVSLGGGDTDKLSTEILKNTINIPPTLLINQGAHIQVMVARDLDFASVYGLELKD